MSIADAKYCFIAVDIGRYGRTNDSLVFKESKIGRLLYEGPLGLPSLRPLPGTEGPPMPFVVVADEAFQMSQNLLKPYASRTLTSTQRIFNYRLTRARRYIECTFGILSGKWRVLTTTLQLRPEHVDEVVKACVVLHNFVISKEPFLLDMTETESNMISLENVAPRSTIEVMRMRDRFVEYFLSDVGRLSWQDKYN